MSVLETLEICFAANLSGVTGQLSGLSQQLRGVSDSVSAAAEGLRPAGQRMMSALSGAIAAGIPKVRAQGASAGNQMVSSLSGAISAGMSGIRGQGASAGSLFAAGARGGAPAARSAGSQLSAGFAGGIRAGRSAISAAVSAVVNSALARMRSLLAIHSPSKVTQGFGEFFAEGFAQGISGSVSRVGRAADGLSGAALDGLGRNMPKMDSVAPLSATVEQALGGVNLTVPMYVDGMKLGEASIRGINAVTKSAGKVLLNI